jgi:hypothetical protein
MEKNKYQVWEGEMEVQHLDANEVTFATVIFSSILGIILFIVLLTKTAWYKIFGIKRITKNTSWRPQCN